MCGIVGVLAKRHVSELLVDGLRRLEYRGYDSAGISTILEGKVATRRALGKLQSLADRLKKEPLAGTIGIGHTRWATHGKPSEENAHPHATDYVSVVHNGIIENHSSLKTELEAKGHVFKSETDTETISHLLTDFVIGGLSPRDAVIKTLARLEGAFALAIIFAGEEQLMFGARRGSPLAVGYGDDDEMYLGSDAMALATLTNRIAYLEEGDWVELTPGKACFYDETGAVVDRKIHQSSASNAIIGKGMYRHFMLKEIFEQPAVIGETVASLLDDNDGIALPKLPFEWKELSRLTIVACGTAYYAGMVAKYWFEQLAHLPVEVDIASEFRYREAPLPEDGAFLIISQSGETADTLAAIAYAKEKGQKIISVVNVPQSSIARQSDCVIPTLAGTEIGVASTKAYTTQLAVLLTLAVAAGLDRGALDETRGRAILRALCSVPSHMNHILREENKLQELAQKLAPVKDVLYLGRGALYPIALEGALKLKEISYIHAEGYPAGELKHGPIALIDKDMHVVVLGPYDRLFEKTASNVQEVVAREGKVIFITDKIGEAKTEVDLFWKMILPDVDEAVLPLIYTVPVQLLAYYTALAKGTDVDQPRNLAKSVTVE